jgi:hypothetical protein
VVKLVVQHTSTITTCRKNRSTNFKPDTATILFNTFFVSLGLMLLRGYSRSEFHSRPQLAAH